MIALRTPLLLLALTGCAPAGDTGPPGEEPAGFEVLLEEILAPSCGTAGCHGATTGAAGLFLDGDRAYSSLLDEPCTNEQALAEGLVRVRPGDPGDSFLYLKIVDPLGMGELMPPTGPLDQAAIEAVERWILEGAQR